MMSINGPNAVTRGPIVHRHMLIYRLCWSHCRWVGAKNMRRVDVEGQERTGGGNFHIHSLRKHSFYLNSFLIWVEHHCSQDSSRRSEICPHNNPAKWGAVASARGPDQLRQSSNIACSLTAENMLLFLLIFGCYEPQALYIQMSFLCWKTTTRPTKIIALNSPWSMCRNSLSYPFWGLIRVPIRKEGIPSRSLIFDSSWLFLESPTSIHLLEEGWCFARQKRVLYIK